MSGVAVIISLFCAMGLAAQVAQFAQPAKASKPPAVFSHKAHLEETNQKCTPCHEGMVTNLNKCDKCHDDPPRFKFLNHSARLSFKFPHSAHEDVKECKACHQDVIDGKRAANTLLVPPEQCFTCHQKFDVEIKESDCAKCHGVDKRKEKPRYHDELWLKGAARHGREARWQQVAEHGKTCSQCHNRSECRTCHDQMAPQDHTGVFRLRMHGATAIWDRDRCKTCHETGTCISCHSNTMPMSHDAGWLTNHGVLLNFLSADNNCRVCHLTVRAGVGCAPCHP